MYSLLPKKLIKLIAGFIIILAFIYHIKNENWVDAVVTEKMVYTHKKQ